VWCRNAAHGREFSNLGGTTYGPAIVLINALRNSANGFFGLGHWLIAPGEIEGAKFQLLIFTIRSPQ
jgi:hypothetical protein